MENLSTEEKRKKLGIPKGANVTFLDLDANRPPPERKTAGWTDSQIRAKTADSIDKEIASNQRTLSILEKQLAELRQRIAGLHEVRARKSQLGD